MFSEKLFFFTKNLKHPFVNASFVPSSSAAAQSMLDGIDFNKVHTVVELGPGTGPYTTELVRRCRKDARIILLEIDSDYVKLLKEKFGDRIIVENIGAEYFSGVLKKYNIDCPDLIVSALPFLPKTSRLILFETIRIYTQKGAIFRFEMILQPWGVRVYRSLPIKRKAFIFKNIPPMWIYGIN